MSIKKTFRCDLGKANYSQLNNKVNPKNTCNSTAYVMALDYMGYKFPDDIFPEFDQPEDKLTMLCYTDDEVLEFYKKLSAPMFYQWVNETKKISEEHPDLQLKDYVYKDSYAPNEVHDVMNFATNLFLGYTEKDIENKDYATHFVSEFNERCVLRELSEGCPVVSSVRFGGCGHYITIVGVQWHDELIPDNIENYIIDNTYGKFNFKTETYEKVSGNDNIIPRKELLARVRPAMHLFIKGAETI